MENESVSIASIAVATPPYVVKQSEALAFVTNHYSKILGPKSLSKMHKIFTHPSVLKRHIAVNDIECLVNENPDIRMARFAHWAVELSAKAVNSAIAQAGLSLGDVSGLVVNTCTGYICPGISTYLLERLGLSDKIRTHDLVGSGCGGSVPNFQICRDMLSSNKEGLVVSVSVEICSATFQMADDLSLIVSNAIFADGAAATVLWNRPGLLKLVTSASRCDTQHREDIRYVYKNGQLHNQLSLQLPEIVSKAVAGVVMDLLTSRGLKMEDIKHWAFHPGGEKVINAVRDELGLSEAHMRTTRDILARYGNMSSPTVLFVLREILNTGISSGDWCAIVAFGAGMSVHGFLLRA
jgi:predicted naringenin-chalcone synthase